MTSYVPDDAAGTLAWIRGARSGGQSARGVVVASSSASASPTRARASPQRQVATLVPRVTRPRRPLARAPWTNTAPIASPMSRQCAERVDCGAPLLQCADAALPRATTPSRARVGVAGARCAGACGGVAVATAAEYATTPPRWPPSSPPKPKPLRRPTRSTSRSCGRLMSTARQVRCRACCCCSRRGLPPTLTHSLAVAGIVQLIIMPWRCRPAGRHLALSTGLASAGKLGWLDAAALAAAWRRRGAGPHLVGLLVPAALAGGGAPPPLAAAAAAAYEFALRSPTCRCRWRRTAPGAKPCR